MFFFTPHLFTDMMMKKTYLAALAAAVMGGALALPAAAQEAAASAAASGAASAAAPAASAAAAASVASAAAAPASEPASAAAHRAAGRVAVVNGQPIPLSRMEAVEAQVKAQAERMGRPTPEINREKMTEDLIMREIFMQEVKKKGVEGTPEAQTKMAMARESVLIGVLLENYQRDNPVTDEEARAEYDRFVESQKPEAGAKEYKASHILVETEDEAKDVVQRLKKGEKFEDIAKRDSKDPGSGSRGGDLGWASPKAYVAEFSEAMQKLEKGAMTDAPIKSQFGWHIIRLDDVRDAQAPQLPEFDKVKPQIVRHLQDKKIGDYQKSLREAAKVE